MRTPIRTFLLPASAVVLGCGLWLAAALADDSAKAGERESTGPDRNQEASGTSGPAEESTSAPARRREPRALLPGSTRPPQPLKKVGDHWTPYDPPDPESFPKDATLHIIVPGDTLWDLADLTFGNPYLWPQIWNENRYILDSHWIYPGDPLLLPPRPTVIGEVVPQGQGGAPGTSGPDGDDGVPGAEMPEEDEDAPRTAAEPATHEPAGPPALADEGDILCGGAIRPKDKRLEYFIANQEEENKIHQTEGDIVYVSRNRKGDLPEPGAEYSIVTREGEVRHPVTNRLLGHYYKRAGTLRVLASQEETSLAKIVMACDYIRTGYELMPLTVGPMPSGTPPMFRRFDTLDPSKPSGYVVHTTDSMKRVGSGYLVDVDLGYEDGMKVGDFLKVYIPTDAYDRYRSMDYDYKWENQRFESTKLRKERGSVPPPRLVGQLVVIATEQRTSTAKVLYSVREIEVGQHVEPY